MKQRFSVLSLLAVLMLLTFMAGAAFGEEAQPLLTRHMPEATLNGQAPLIGHLPANQSMRIVLVLPIRDQAGLDNFLKEAYDKNSPSYRKFLTVEQFTEKFGPTQDDYNALIQFAENNGFTVVKQSRNRLNLDVTGTVANIEKAFNIRMGLYQHPTESRTFFSPDREPTTNLQFQLWHIGGLDNYATPKPMYKRLTPAEKANVQSNATTGSGPDASFLGSDMRAAYYSAEGGTLTGTGQSVGLFEFLGTDLTDLDTYYKNVNQTNSVPITLTSVDTQSTLCSEKTDCDDTEQTLDMTQALGMAPGMSGLTMWIGTGGLAGQSLDDAGILNGMVTAKPLQAQLSCSWAWKPTDNTTDDPYFEEMAAQGQTFFVAAGDDGNWSHAGFVWPADDVNIVSVGGTLLTTSSAAGPWASEVVWDQDGDSTGGGISPNKFTIPSWQTAAAAGCSACSQLYRNGPDVAANAAFTFYVCADQTTCTANDYGGTSFAAPMWAGYMALTNEQYLTNTGGTTTLGFINPALYDIGLGADYDTDFHDITSGCQAGAGKACATVGFDLVTGWGSPTGPALLNALAGTVAGSFTLSASPNKIKIAQGSSGTSTITSSISGDFDSAITLSASLKTATFNPSTIAAPGSGTSTMTITVPKSTPTGIHRIEVTGTGGGITEHTVVEIDVTE